MAGFFKKRRKPAPNKNEAKIRRGLEAEALERSVATLGQQFPDISSLKLSLRFLDPRGNPLSEETLEFGPGDQLAVKFPCPGLCGGNGSYDIEGTISGAIAAKRPNAEGRAKCRATLYAGLPDECGCELAVRVDASFRS